MQPKQKIITYSPLLVTELIIMSIQSKCVYRFVFFQQDMSEDDCIQIANETNPKGNKQSRNKRLTEETL